MSTEKESFIYVGECVKEHTALVRRSVFVLTFEANALTPSQRRLDSPLDLRSLLTQLRLQKSAFLLVFIISCFVCFTIIPLSLSPLPPPLHLHLPQLLHLCLISSCDLILDLLLKSKMASAVFSSACLCSRKEITFVSSDRTRLLLTLEQQRKCVGIKRRNGCSRH